MSRMFYAKMAVNGLRKNKRTFLPYALASAGTIAIFYIILSISENPGLGNISGGVYIKTILPFGSVVIGIFSMIFLFYTNSFLMKQRQKELALYNILGMDKRHIARMLIWENLFLSGGSLLAGLGVGILLSKLLFLLLLKIVGIHSPLEFVITWKVIYITGIVFAGIFIAILLNNLRQIHLNNPIQLLLSASAGEKEPKTRWLLTLAGLVLTGSGYYMAIVTKSPLQAISVLFVAIVLVILGTYALFTAGSVLILKLMKKNTSYYYKEQHFVSVSGLIYRMKKNAAGLASICVMSTAVLLLISTTVSLYFGNQSTVENRYPYDINIVFHGQPQEKRQQIRDTARQTVEEHGLSVEEEQDIVAMQEMGAMEDGEFLTDFNGMSLDANMGGICLMTAEEYTNIMGKSLELEDGSVGLFVYEGDELDQITFYGRTYPVGAKISDFRMKGMDAGMDMETYYIFLKDQAAWDQMLEDKANTVSHSVGTRYSLNMDISGTKEEQINISQVLSKKLGEQFKTDDFSISYVESRQASLDEMLIFNGSFFFLGILLGSVFLIGTVLIIYYKQVTEGYEDKRRYEIMEKVGMGSKEIRQSIKSQILKVFFLPLIMAIIHVSAAFPLMTRLLSMLNLFNHKLFLLCTLGTVFAFALIYSLVYTLTARTYYKIVK